MLKIPENIYGELVARAREGAPLEICGYLAGGADGEVKTHYPLTNTDASAEHFSFDPKEQFAAFKDATARGQRLIVCYHSHPATPARPSAEDIKLAYDPNISYVIISLSAAEPVVKSFKIKAGTVTNEEIEIT
ncbi:MAG: M67 family metallopeptidase [Verrucomicrobiales bacterium]|jgi:proteasome lid subunit RPN8/RPN11|nr:M67 family metallopeptidase [Verrucomicrobiales bacterium]